MATTVKEILTKRDLFSGGLEARRTSTTQDQRLLNVYQETINASAGRVALVKRPGLTLDSQMPEAGQSRGIFYFGGHLYVIIEDRLYKDGVEVLTLNTDSGGMGYVECNYAGTVYMFFCDGTDGYLVDDGGDITQIQTTYDSWVMSTTYAEGDVVRPSTETSLYYTCTVAGTSNSTEPTWPTTIGTTVVDGGVTWTCSGYYGGFPSPHIPTPVFIDGYILLPRASSADIYNSGLGDPNSWNPMDFIESEMFADPVTALARQNNQVVAFGAYGTEFFFDNGANQKTGTPLARNQNTFLQVGCPAPFAIGQSEQNCFFIGESQTGGRAVWKLDGFTATKVPRHKAQTFSSNLILYS